MELYKVNSEFFYMVHNGKVYHNNAPKMDGNEIESFFTADELRQYLDRVPGVIEPANLKAVWAVGKANTWKVLLVGGTFLAAAAAVLFL